ncbi:hypothetical protein pEaSNUABM54_00173 [Erwinia phage pEa_SNUABM_54]|nr:hypothetical protein pEaSNUABM54_00173 [Erwinia phage pEa_SNUABM_54]
MGQSLSGRAQRLVNGVWENLPIEIDGVRHEDNVGWRELVGVENRGHLGYVQYEFLLSGDDGNEDDFKTVEVPVFIKPRGFPPEYVETLNMDGYHDHPEYENGPITWFLIDEFLNFPFDQFYHEGFTARQIIGQACIDYFQSLKDQGAERIVLWL